MIKVMRYILEYDTTSSRDELLRTTSLRVILALCGYVPPVMWLVGGTDEVWPYISCKFKELGLCVHLVIHLINPVCNSVADRKELTLSTREA